MINFLNDYNDKGHEKVYEFLARLPEEKMPGYGQDDYTISVKEKLKKEIGRDDIVLEFFTGGTIVNLVACTNNLRSYEAIVCARSGHVATHECGSVEATGHKLVTIDTEDGKLNPELLERQLKIAGPETDVIPKIVYISNTTETGLVYSIEEIKALHKVCKAYDCFLFVDGARLAVALAREKFSLKELSESCDAFTIGGTKNGAIFGEILVLVADEFKIRLRNHMKQKGAILAKGYILAAQFDALFDQGLYYDLGKNAYETAMRLADGFSKLGFEFYYPPESNQIFVKLNDQQIEAVKNFASFEIVSFGGYETVPRFCTFYRTTSESVDEFLEKLKEIL